MKIPILEIDKTLGRDRPITVNKEHIAKKYKQIRRKYNTEIEQGPQRIRNTYDKDDKVLIFRKTQNKFRANWHSGYKIFKKISEDAYLVKRGNSILRVNKTHIRRN